MQEIQELKSTLNAIEGQARETRESKEEYERGRKEVHDLRQSL